MKQRLRAVRVASLAITATGLLAATPGPGPIKTGAVSSHVIVISLDGLRPDAIDRFGATTLQRLSREGAYSYRAQTIFPSKTLPSHTSMLTGVDPDVHGILWNNDRTGSVGVVKSSTVFVEAKKQGFTTAAFFSKSKFRHLQVPGSLDYTQAPRGMDTWMATRTVGDAITYLHHRKPNLLFVHVGEADYAGHSMGWMSTTYGMAVRRADGAVNSLMNAADKSFGKGNYTVIVSADHGGHGRDHGTDDPQDTTIPWIVWGKGVSAGAELNGVRTLDTAATVLWLLGVRAPENWKGSAVATAFTPAAQLASANATGVVMKASH